MVDWMFEDNISYCRVVLSCHKYERVQYNIIFVNVSSVICYCRLGFWSLNLYIKNESLLIELYSCEIILDRYLCEVLEREDSAPWSLVQALLVFNLLCCLILLYTCTRPSPSKYLLEAC